jgi:glycosyltransferase involved in cell wall biosynthesis
MITCLGVRRLRVLMTCYEFPPLGGGGSRVVSGLTNELAALGHHVDLVTMGFRELPRLEVIGRVNVHRVPCLRFRIAICTPPELLSYLLGAWPVVQRLVRESRPDIIHSHFIFPDGLLAMALKRRSGIPNVITAHGSDVPGYNPDRLRALHVILAPIWKRVVRQANAIISPSQSLADLIRAGHYNGPLGVIPNGYSVKSFAAARHRPGNLLVVSRLFERKGVQYLLQALEDFDRPLDVHIVGEGPYLSTLKQVAQRLRTRAVVHFHGWLDNGASAFRELIETASIFALPSEAENFPNALLEAMAAGLAIITTTGTGCAEVVGPTALLVPPRNAARIRAAIDQLSADPAFCDELGRAAQARVRGMFSWRSVAEQHVGTYERAVHTARS